MKKAYLIMAHKNPRQLKRLVARLKDGHSGFFIHIDIKVDIDPFKDALKEFGNAVCFIKRFDSKWGSYGTIEPFIEGLREVRKSAVGYERIMLISGQDYPIKSNEEMDEFFRSSPHSVFLNYFPIPNMQKWPGSDRGGLYRVDKYYFGSKKGELFRSRALNFLTTYLPFLRRKLPNGMKPYTGQTWWTLDDYAMNYILDYHDQHPEYFRFHRHTFVADELYVQMIVGNSKDQRLLNSIENSEKRFTIWHDERDAHPKFLRAEDIDAIMASDDFFARKFDDNIDSEILDLIDERILFKNTAEAERVMV